MILHSLAMQSFYYFIISRSPSTTYSYKRINETTCYGWEW